MSSNIVATKKIQPVGATKFKNLHSIKYGKIYSGKLQQIKLFLPDIPFGQQTKHDIGVKDKFRIRL